MTKRGKIEAEIERNRNLANWTQLREDGRMLAEKVGKDDGAVVLIQAEFTKYLKYFLLGNSYLTFRGICDAVFLKAPNFCTKFDPLNDFFKRRASYHLKA